MEETSTPGTAPRAPGIFFKATNQEELRPFGEIMIAYSYFIFVN
jgi:hypothetical protein